MDPWGYILEVVDINQPDQELKVVMLELKCHGRGGAAAIIPVVALATVTVVTAPPVVTTIVTPPPTVIPPTSLASAWRGVIIATTASRGTSLAASWGWGGTWRGGEGPHAGAGWEQGPVVEHGSHGWSWSEHR